MRTGLWRRLRFVLRGGAARRRRVSARRPPLPLSNPSGNALVNALVRLRQAVDEERVADLPLAWFRVDEAKAAAVWYDVGKEPAHAAVLPEEQALAERVFRLLTGQEATLPALLNAPHDGAAMVRYRLLVAKLPAWTAACGRRTSEAVRAAYELMARSPEVLSPYGRWLLARTVCLAARDREELARQTEHFRTVTADLRGADGSSMAFISGGEYELPLPVATTEILDHPLMPTRIEVLKKDAPKDVQRFFLRLTPRGQRVFLRAFLRRQEAYQHGYPWRKPPWLSSEGTIFIRTPIQLSAFYVDRRPVTNDAFHDFVIANRLWLPSRLVRYGADPETYLAGWRGDAPVRGTAAEPVTGVSYQAARAYVAWAGKQLPSEAQWLYALLGNELPEARNAGETRPVISAEERLEYGGLAARRGLHIHLPERIHDFDGSVRLSLLVSGLVLRDPRGPTSGRTHVWRAPAARGVIADRLGDPNLTFRGVVPASAVWAQK